MDCESRECSHINQITDTNTGDFICTDCGLVIDRVFIFPEKEKNSENASIGDDFLAELLEKLHLSKNSGVDDGTEKDFPEVGYFPLQFS